MKLHLKSTVALALLGLATVASAQITFYENESFLGRTFLTDKPVENFARYGFNDRASSVIVDRGRWEVCEDARYAGRCVVLRPGNYDTLKSMGMNNRISSVHPADAHANMDDDVYAPTNVSAYEYRRRPNERLQQAPVTSVRAVVGPPNERCWVERQQVAGATTRGGPNVGGAIAGALIGGILGHQVGGGVGKDIATVGGAAAGGYIGSNVGRNTTAPSTEHDVRRCEKTPSATPTYWDVTYKYRGQTHRVQMSKEPGRTILVNRNGDPRD
jgi:uncharacterized protein YcfJ